MTIFDVAIILILLLTIILKPIGYYPGGRCNKSCNIYLFIVGAILVLIPGFRDMSIGLDTYQYVDFFESLPEDLIKAFNESRFEEGYVLLNYLFKKFDFWLAQTAVSMLSVGMIFYMIKKYSPMIWLSCLLFVLYCFYYRCFNEMRQAVALGIICVSFKFLAERKLRYYLACLALAALFHRTSLIFITSVVIFFVYKIKWWHVLCIMGGIDVLVEYSTIIIQTFLPFFLTDYSNIEEGAGGWGLFAIQVLTFGLALYRYKYLSEDRTNIIALFLLIMAIMIFPICHFNPMLFRLEDYFWVFMIILVPRIIQTFKSTVVRHLACIGYLVIGYFFYFVKIFSEANEILPYKFLWE